VSRFWGLYLNGKLVPPLKYSNGKTQEDVIKEIVNAFYSYDVVVLRGGVGTGKSAIAIHVTAIVGHGRGIIVVPTKSLEEQYVKDYGGGKYTVVVKGRMVSFKYIMGRHNYVCKYRRKCKANHPELPCTRRLTTPDGQKLRRIDVAKECPYWMPIVPEKHAQLYKHILNDVNYTYEYESVSGKRKIFVRDEPCSFYCQFLSYAGNNVILMNSAIWELETLNGRKPRVNIEVIDEADGWLDSLSFQRSISVRTIQKLIDYYKEDSYVADNLDALLNEFTLLLEKYKNYTGAMTEDWFNFIDTYSKIFEEIGKETNLEVLLSFQDEVWTSVDYENARVRFFIPNLRSVLGKILSKSARNILMMSATFPPKHVLEEVYGLDDVCFVDGETRFPGTVYLKRTGMETVVTHKKWSKIEFRQHYYKCLENILKNAKRPLLVQVHAKKYLPPSKKNEKLNDYAILNCDFDEVWSTVAKRGIDLKGDKCRSIVILKYPIPDLSDGMVQAIRLKLGDRAFFMYVKDRADREVIQQVGRAVRSQDDWVEVWSPDLAVHNAIKRCWKGRLIATKSP